MIQSRKVGRPKKPLEQKRTERVVIMLTPEEKHQLKHYIAEQPMSLVFREAINIIYKLSPLIKTERGTYRLDDIESFIREIERALRNEDIELTVKSERSVIKVKAGHISFEAPQPLINKAVIKQILEQLEQKCRNLIESPPVAEFILQDDRFKYVAPRITEVAGYGNERLLNESVFDLVYPDDRGEIEEVLQKGLMEREIPLQIKFRALKDNGQIIYVNASVILIEYEGRPAIVGSFIDLTEWNELQQGLEKLERMIEIS